jgi:hypothetical protein
MTRIRTQSPKSGPGRAGTADRSASSHRGEKTAGRAGSGDSGRPVDTGAEATLTRLAALWTEYAALTRGEWRCNRAVDLRAEIRKVLEVKP